MSDVHCLHFYSDSILNVSFQCVESIFFCRSGGFFFGKKKERREMGGATGVFSQSIVD